jgi:hypothetical protein
MSASTATTSLFFIGEILQEGDGEKEFANFTIGICF